MSKVPGLMTAAISFILLNMKIIRYNVITVAIKVKKITLRRLPTVQPIFGHLGNTSALINTSYFFQLDMKIQHQWNV